MGDPGMNPPGTLAAAQEEAVRLTELENKHHDTSAQVFWNGRDYTIFKNYEVCMLRMFYASGGNDKPSTAPVSETMHPNKLARTHNECFSEVLNGKGDSEGYGPIADGTAATVNRLDDLLRCDYVWNKNIAQFYLTFDGELQYRICRHMNRKVKLAV
jgi:hypothetical protein